MDNWLLKLNIKRFTLLNIKYLIKDMQHLFDGLEEDYIGYYDGDKKEIVMEYVD